MLPDRSGGGRGVRLGTAVVTAWIAADQVREVHAGQADAASWVNAAAAVVALASAVAIARWPEGRRTAWLMLLWLFCGVLPNVGGEWPYSRLAETAMLLGFALQAPTYAHMALSYPAGAVRHRRERAFLGLAYGVSLAAELTAALWGDPRGCGRCSVHVPSLLFTGHTIGAYDTLTDGVFATLFIGLGLAFIALVGRRIRTAPPGARRTLLPLVLAACFAGGEFALRWAAILVRWAAPLPALDWVDMLNTALLPLAIFAGLATIRRHRGPVGDLIVALRSAGPDDVERELARAVGDPALELALWLPADRRFVDVAGHPVDVDGAPAHTLVGPAERPVAALLHDPGLIGQRDLLEAAGAAALLALENARLQAELRAHVAELRASRARIITAGDAERARLERDLHDGAQQRLLALGLGLQLLAEEHPDSPLLAEVQAELQSALRDLRELARGIHPAILTHDGLPAAVGSLADRAPIPISVTVARERHPQAVETAAYFVVSEALANIAKHARARSGSVAIERVDGRLIVEVRDDGHGGADVHAGTGLRGLADRVGALDGRLTVDSARDAGTTIRAEIPCAS